VRQKAGRPFQRSVRGFVREGKIHFQLIRVSAKVSYQAATSATRRTQRL
jgi:hypothetical protein